MAERITALFVKHSKRPGKYPDGGNLYLQVRKSTRNVETDGVTKSWLFRYLRFGKDTWLGLGPYPDVTLSVACDLATRERKKKYQGIDPLTDKRARQIAARTAHENMLSFAECAELYIESRHPAGVTPNTSSNGAARSRTSLAQSSAICPSIKLTRHSSLPRTDLGHENRNRQPVSRTHGGGSRLAGCARLPQRG